MHSDYLPILLSQLAVYVAGQKLAYVIFFTHHNSLYVLPNVSRAL